MRWKNLSGVILLCILAAGGWAAPETGAVCPDTLEGLPLLYASDFEKDAARWIPTDSSAWKVTEEDGTQVYSLFGASRYEPEVRSPRNISLLSDIEVTDFILEVKIRQTGREYGHRDGCVFFGYTGPSQFYYAHMATKADEHANRFSWK